MMDDLLEALKHLRAAGRQDRRNEAVLHNLVPVYLGLGFFSHCLRVLRRYQRTELAFEKGNDEELSGMRASLEEHQREAAAHLSLQISTTKPGTGTRRPRSRSRRGIGKMPSLPRTKP